MSRPEIPIDWDIVDDLIEMQCTAEEIAGEFHMAIRTFYNKVNEKYNDSFSNYCISLRSKGKGKLRRKQWEKAVEEGHPQLLLKLGELYLDQKQIESIEQKLIVEHVDATSTSPSQVQVPPLSGCSMDSNKE